MAGNRLSRSVRGAPSISAPACREGRSPAARLTCARQSARDRAASRRRACGPPARRRPETRPSPRLQPSPRRTGPAVALDDGCALIACRLVALLSPASRPSTPRRAFSQPRAGIGAARRPPGSARFAPASARRPASEPPSTRPHTPNRRRGALLWPAQPGSDPFGRRSAACRPTHQRSVRCDLALNPAPAAHVAASPTRRQPLKLPGSRLRRPVRDPRHPHPGPPLSSRRGQGRAHTYMPARAAWGIFRKKIRERETARRPRPAQFPGAAGAKGTQVPVPARLIVRRQDGAARGARCTTGRCATGPYGRGRDSRVTKRAVREGQHHTGLPDA